MAELVSQPTSIQSLYGLFKDGRLYVNRRYQRKLVWTLEEKQRLVESILKKYPIPAILVAEKEGSPGAYEIIDGLQRLHSIVSYIEQSFPTVDERYFDLTFFPTAKSRADDGEFTPVDEGLEKLSQAEVTTFLDYSLGLSVMRNASEAEVNDVFRRINTYGRRLSDQERRQAGVQNEFSSMVRTIACTARGDASSDQLLLNSMPSISIDLPKTQHGYEVQADEVFWVQQGILRATDLRDSMDEQCIADIAACIVGGKLIERSKDALDAIYDTDSAESIGMLDALNVYGEEKFADEFKFCVDQILKVCSSGEPQKLRSIIFKTATTNAFPTLFATILISFHELIVGEGKRVSDFAGVHKALIDVASRLETSRKATSSEERRKNVDTVKGLISDCFVDGDVKSEIYGSHATIDIDATIRRSEIELSHYELKQGLLSLGENRVDDDSVGLKVVNTICAMANNGPGRGGKIVIGVTDKESDARRVEELDGVQPRRVGRRFVVGVAREARILELSMEGYFAKWRDIVRNSGLTPSLRDEVLSSMDFNSYYGFGVIVISVPPQNKISFVDDLVYWRDADSTVEARSGPQIASIAGRFS